MRIHIIGGPGTGKSFMGRRLSESLGLPLLELDRIHSAQVDVAARDDALQQFVQQPGWIVEGVYHRWVEPSFTRADHILVLQAPLWLRQVRILRRYLWRKLGWEAGKDGDLRALWSFLKWSAAYDADNLGRAMQLLHERGLSYRVCHSFEEIHQAVTTEPP